MEQVIGRQDLVEADLRCLMCSRLIGQLAGLVWRDARTQRSDQSTVSWTVFRPANPGVPPSGRDRFRCGDCGGVAVMEEVSVSVARDPLPVVAECPIHRDRVAGRGRRPKGCQCDELRLAA